MMQLGCDGGQSLHFELWPFLITFYSLCRIGNLPCKAETIVGALLTLHSGRRTGKASKSHSTGCEYFTID